MCGALPDYRKTLPTPTPNLPLSAPGASDRASEPPSEPETRMRGLGLQHLHPDAIFFGLRLGFISQDQEASC